MIISFREMTHYCQKLVANYFLTNSSHILTDIIIDIYLFTKETAEKTIQSKQE
jgi:hypothetical protein